jgi:hypothetical protein
MPLFEQLGEMFNPANAANKHKIPIPSGHSATVNRYRDCIVVEIERQLLIDFFMFFRENGEKHLGKTIEQFVDLFLSNK